MATSGSRAPSGTQAAALGLAAVIVGVFALQWALGEHGRLGELTPEALLAQGALEGSWVRLRGDLYRVASSVLLHRSWAHAVFTAAPIAFAAWLAPAMGGWRILAWFALGGLAGSASALVLGPAAIVTAGGAGGALAVVASALLTGLRAPPQPGRFLNVLSTAVTLLTALVIQVLASPSFLPGAVLAAVGLAVVASRAPAPGPLVRAVALAGAAVLVAGTGLAFAKRGEIALNFGLRAGLAPDGALDRLRITPANRRGPAIEELVREYPRDPRPRHYRALLREEDDQLPEAEEDLAQALAGRDVLERFFPDGKLEAQLRTALARVQLARGATDEARRTLAPACAVLGPQPPKNLSSALFEEVCRKKP